MQFPSGDKIISVIIPCLNEETPIAGVVSDVLAQNVDEVIVVDNGSTDRTAERAAAAGARVIAEPRRGYGRACAAGVHALRGDADIVCFLDGDGSDAPEFLPAVVCPIAEGNADFVMGSRIRGRREPGSLTPQQIAAGWLAGHTAAADLRGTFHRHVTLPGDCCGPAAFVGYDRADLWLELGDADARCGVAMPHLGNPGRSPLPPRRHV